MMAAQLMELVTTNKKEQLFLVSSNYRKQVCNKTQCWMGQELSLKTIYVLADGEGMLKQPLATNSLAVLQSAMFSIIKGMLIVECWCNRIEFARLLWPGWMQSSRRWWPQCATGGAGRLNILTGFCKRKYKIQNTKYTITIVTGRVQGAGDKFPPIDV